MQYLHQSTYGHVGQYHTAKPIFAMKDSRLYEMKDGRPDTKPVYAVRDNKVYATQFHPNGGSPHAMFTIKGNQVHTTQYHPFHNPSMNAFRVSAGPK